MDLHRFKIIQNSWVKILQIQPRSLIRTVTILNAKENLVVLLIIQNCIEKIYIKMKIKICVHFYLKLRIKRAKCKSRTKEKWKGNTIMIKIYTVTNPQWISLKGLILIFQVCYQRLTIKTHRFLIKSAWRTL